MRCGVMVARVVLASSMVGAMLPLADAVGCLIGRAREPEAGATITYSNRIAHILQERCVDCHRSGDIAPFALTNYDEAAAFVRMPDDVVGIGEGKGYFAGYVPPWWPSI